MSKKVKKEPVKKEPPAESPDKVVLREVLHSFQLYATHPLIANAVTSGVERIFRHVGRPDLADLWGRLVQGEDR